jgi:GMP synthase-like glutamine amidotransferase
MRLHVFQHVPFEGPANIARWAGRRGFPVVTTRLYAGQEPPPLDEFDLLAVMGGPMGVHDEPRHPWLKTEKRFLERALGAGKRVVGVCLGSQLLAEVLGGRVYRHAHAEIGWHAVRRGRDAARSSIGPALPAEALAFHWHGDAFDLPPGALHLLSSECTPNQAFECGTALGLLCHLEVTPESVAAMLEHGADEIGAGPYAQSAADILAAPRERYAALEGYLAALLDRLVD